MNSLAYRVDPPMHAKTLKETPHLKQWHYHIVTLIKNPLHLIFMSTFLVNVQAFELLS